ncbi:MAG: glycosyltransferase, partial [Thermoproteota archaeon]
MRLLFLITGLDYGGAETQLVRKLPMLKARGWEICVVSLLAPRAYVQDIEALGIPVISLGIQKKRLDPCAITRLATLIRQYKPHIVHSHMVHANLLARFIRLFVSIP